MIPNSHMDLLEGPSFAHVATIGPDGEPHSSPVWVEWDGEHIKIGQLETRQKYRNLRRDPRVALSIIDLDNPYRYVEVRGRAVRFEPDPDGEFADRLAKKYLGLDRFPHRQPGDRPVVVYVTPEHSTHMG